MRIPQWIMIHHSLTADSGTVSWAAIERYHIETNGWKDVGYHAGVELVAGAEYGAAAYQALYGRSTGLQASACPQGGMNSLALHVCVVGNYDISAPSDAILRRLVQRILLPWMAIYGIPSKKIVGHRDYNPAKSCPGKRFDLEVVRRMVS